MYEESLHIPLLIRWPEGIQPGTVNYDLGKYHFAPTLIELAVSKFLKMFRVEVLSH